MNATRAGKGCGACKPLVKDIVEWAVTEGGGELGVDESANWYVPAIPMDKPTLIAAIKERNLRSVSAVLAALAPERRGRGVEDAADVAAAGGLERRVRQRERREVHQRPRARQHPARRHVLRRPADQGRRHDRRRAAAHRGRRGQVRDPDDQDHRRAADRPARRAQGGPARGVGGPRHALGLRVRQVVPHGEELRRHRLLPLRPGRLDDPGRAPRADATRAWRARRR